MIKKQKFSNHEEIEIHLKLMMKDLEPSKLRGQIEAFIKHLDEVIAANGDYV